MCKIMEDIVKEERIESALTMLEHGIPKDQIVLFTKLTIEEVEELVNRKNA